MDPKPRLSCEQCRRRKTKCDKQAPCSSCKAAGLICEVVQRDRLPRGKSGKTKPKSSGVLESRVSRIEALLAQAQVISNNGNKSEPKPSPGDSSPGSGASESDLKFAARTNGYVAADFWQVLSQEVAGLRETFNEDSDDESTPPPDLISAYSKMDISSEHSKLLFAASPSSVEAYLPPYPPDDLRSLLLASYSFRCESICKLVHWPTRIAKIEAANANHHEGSSMADIATECAIYFMAVCSITEQEAPFTLPQDRTTLLQQYMKAAEWALGQCNLLQRPDVDSLLAFTLYLNCIWACGKYATKWTLVAIAVRIGEALGLGREDPNMYTPFDLECRRRLWWGIGVLDTHSTYDRGSFPLMTSMSLGPLPSNINDTDMSPESKTITPSTGFTDMAFSLLAYEAVVHNKKMLEAQDWDTKLQLVQDYQDIAQKAINTASGDTPLERLNQEGARAIASNMQLLLRRPPYRVERNHVPASDDFDILGCAITILEGYLNKQKGDLAAWEWKDWIPWYALAVVLAELCKTPSGPLSDRAWAAALSLYQRHARPSNDLESGMLWKPITKLMRRVQRERPDAGLAHLGLRKVSLTESPPLAQQQQQQSQMPNPLHAQNYASINSNASLNYNPLWDFNGGTIGANTSQSQPTMPTHPTTSTTQPLTEMPNWPAFNPNTSLFDLNNRGLNAKLYNDLDPANGVSWMDWDAFLDDQGFPMTLG